MNVLRWSWLLLAALALAAPGCLLVQPLDDAKSDAGGAGGATSSGGKTNNGGKGGAGPAPSGGRGGAGPAPSGGEGGAGPLPTGGAPSGVDFSYFTGTWTVDSGTISTDCGTGPTDTPAQVGSTDTITLGTTSDLIVDEGTQCPILADVNDLVATGQDGQTCDFSDTSGTYHLVIDSFDFVVSGDHQSATSNLTSEITLTVNGVATNCSSNQILNYTR